MLTVVLSAGVLKADKLKSPMKTTRHSARRLFIDSGACVTVDDSSPAHWNETTMKPGRCYDANFDDKVCIKTTHDHYRFSIMELQ